MSKIDQKEYLKRYLSGEKTKKKKKRKVKGEQSRIKIIDDNVDIINKQEEDYDLILTGEDAPQIVGIIDDRPPELKAIEDFRGSEKWKSLSSSSSSNKKNHKSEKNLQKIANRLDYYRDNKNTANSLSDDNDISLKRKNQRLSDNDISPSRKRRENKRGDSDDFSPVRKQNKVKVDDDDGDLSPERKRNHTQTVRRKSRDSNSDYSPPRKSSRKSEDLRRNANYSPKNSQKKSRADSSDYSPPRKTSRSQSSHRKRSRDKSYSPSRKEHNRNDKNEKFQSRHRGGSSDYSSPRRNDVTGNSRKNSKDNSPPRQNISKSTTNKNSHSSIHNMEKSKIDRTLDGKKAGLQNASALKTETELFRKREDEMFKKMSSDMSGQNTEIGVRNSRRKTTAEIEREQEREREKNIREEKKQKIYSRWGAGLKQIENYENKIAEEIHEINKPLARYSNDADLDDMLKKQEREGDPMLAYIREKTKEAKKNSKTPIMPIYKGSFPENRYNIRPGYRWDGVDRSNGYEKKWFDVQNQKKAIQEEAYKYSVEDM